MRIIKKIKQFGWGFAIVEIILITVGILMAIQIDTWKESFKEKQLEQKVLAEIKSSLKKDLEFLSEMIIPRTEEVLVSLEIVINHIHNKSEYNDSIHDHAYKITYGMEFEPRTSAFENLKTIGVNLISNNSLRLTIVELYDLQYERDLRIIDNVINNYRQSHLLPYMTNKLEYQVEIKDNMLKRDENGQIITKLVVPKEVLYGKEFFNILSARYWSFYETYRRFIRIEEAIKILIEEIEQELDRLN